jgi:F0F1-type ATP synthase membrane subunit c/vacuolar-type H+-ATPase subunit K
MILYYCILIGAGLLCGGCLVVSALKHGIRNLF